MESSKEKVGFFKDGDDKLFKGGFGFTKDNELFVGRMAQLGFAASLIGELYTGDPFSPFFWHLWLWAGSRPGARGGGTSGPRGGTGGGGPRRLPRREFAAHCDRWALPRVSLSGGPEHRMVPEQEEPFRKPFIDWNRSVKGQDHWSSEPGILLSQDSLQQCCNRLCLWSTPPPDPHAGRPRWTRRGARGRWQGSPRASSSGPGEPPRPAGPLQRLIRPEEVAL